jgi:hypothetical protein
MIGAHQAPKVNSLGTDVKHPGNGIPGGEGLRNILWTPIDATLMHI